MTLPWALANTPEGSTNWVITDAEGFVVAFVDAQEDAARLLGAAGAMVEALGAR